METKPFLERDKSTRELQKYRDAGDDKVLVAVTLESDPSNPDGPTITTNIDEVGGEAVPTEEGIKVIPVTVKGSVGIDSIPAINIGHVGGDAVPEVDGVPAIPVLSVGGGTATPSLDGEYSSAKGDFTAEFLSSNTINISAIMSLIISDNSQIVGVKVLHADNTAEIFVGASNDISFSYSSGILTIHGATPFLAGDVYNVVIDGQKKGYDPSSGLNLGFQANEPKRGATSIEHLEISTAAIGTTVEILRGFNSHAIHELSGIIAAGHVITVWSTHKSDADETLVSKNGWTDRTLEIFGEATLSNEPGALGKLKDTMPIMVALEITAAAATAAASDIYYNHFAN